MSGPMFYGQDPLFTKFVELVDACPLIRNDFCRCDGRKPKCLRLWDTTCNQSSHHHITEKQFRAYARRFERLVAR